MPVGAAIGGATVASAGLGYLGAGKQADATRAGANAAAAAERYKIDRSLAASRPVRDVGNAAMNALASLYIPDWSGLKVNEDGKGGADYRLGKLRPNAFQQLPWNKFLLEQSNDQLQNAFGQAGSPVGGNAMRALGQNTYQSILSDSVNPLMQLAGFGPAGAGMAGNAIAGDQTGAIRMAQGNNQAAAIGGQYGSINNALQGGLSNYLTYNALNPSGWNTPGAMTPNVVAPDGLKYWGATPNAGVKF